MISNSKIEDDEAEFWRLYALAKRGDSVASTLLAWAIEHGVFSNISHCQKLDPVNFYSVAAETVPFARYSLAKLLLKRKRISEGREMLRSVAADHFPEALALLAFCENGFNRAPDIALLTAAAEKGDAFANFAIGMMNFDETGQADSAGVAIAHLSKSYELGYEPALCMLALAKLQGRIDEKHSLETLERLAESGDELAVRWLMNIYRYGLYGQEQNLSKMEKFGKMKAPNSK